MSDLLFLGIVAGANAGPIALAVRILGDERAECRARLAAFSLGQETRGANRCERR